jgi:folate-binding Fe-S cluster repair protein YgfZ
VAALAGGGSLSSFEFAALENSPGRLYFHVSLFRNTGEVRVLCPQSKRKSNLNDANDNYKIKPKANLAEVTRVMNTLRSSTA